MRGGAQSHLMLGTDGHAYVVKFQNNPQHPRVLVNELLATRLAKAVGLTVPTCEVVEVSEWLIKKTADLDLDFGNYRERCKPGLHFGSQLVGGLMPGQTADYLPEERLEEVRNLEEFAGMLAFDKWTCNANGRQAVFHKRTREKRYAATFIDHGHCFDAGEWRFVDAPLRGVYARNIVYRQITGWKDFEPWLSRIEALAADKLWEIMDTIPPEWYDGNAEELELLGERLLERRGRVRELITDFRESSREPFPNWERPLEERGTGRFAEPEWADTLHEGKFRGRLM
uniref:Phosphatidylinositol kinase n=2 Tax=Paracidobacterium acidisoli TaxID=2303751 RepID=A0A372INS4_9BACT